MDNVLPRNERCFYLERWSAPEDWRRHFGRTNQISGCHRSYVPVTAGEYATILILYFTMFYIPLIHICSFPTRLEQFKGTHKTGSKTWRFRCLLEKFEGTHGDFTQRLAGYTDDPYAFCDEVERSTSGIVTHERKESSPELFSSPTPTAQEKGSASTKQSRKRKDPPSESEEPGPSKRTKEVADIEAELQDHYIGTISFSLFLSLCLLLILCSPITQRSIDC